jgi:hypothetical protein
MKDETPVRRHPVKPGLTSPEEITMQTEQRPDALNMKYAVGLADSRQWTVVEYDTQRVIATYAYGHDGYRAASELIILLNTNQDLEVTK